MCGVFFGTEYLKSAVERQQFCRETTLAPSAQGRHVVIIGTGDTASDCVATALRQGCASVVQLVRRPQADYLDAQGRLPGTTPMRRRWPSRERTPAASVFRSSPL